MPCLVLSVTLEQWLIRQILVLVVLIVSEGVGDEREGSRGESLAHLRF